jgi:broad specificity phosphatase PhoE
MEIYLIRHGEADSSRSTDPRTPPLTPTGQAHAAHLARRCREWDVQFLCVSTMRRAQETADAASRALPEVLRWDLDELEDMNLDDLPDASGATSLVSTWSQEHLLLGRQRTWKRVTAAWARIVQYAARHELERVAIISHGGVLAFLLFSWLGLDWRDASRLDVSVQPGSSCKVSLGDDEGVRIHWINRA